MKLTPLEVATGIIINDPSDIIYNWEGASKLIYCYKNNKNLIEWASLLSEKFLEECMDKQFSDLSSFYAQDFLQIGLYLNCMKKNKWDLSVKQKEVVRTIDILLNTLITSELINRDVRREGGGMPDLIINEQNGSNKYDISSYTLRFNEKIKIIAE